MQNMEDIGELVRLADLEDGSSVFEVQDGESEEEQASAPTDWYRNLAEELPASDLVLVASEILEGIKDDQDSRAEWEQGITIGLKYLGLKPEEYRNVPFMKACAAFDSTMSTGLIRFWSTARAELFPFEGPANISIIGQESRELEEQGERVKKWVNYYLTEVDKEYYPDSERLLMWVGLMGCAFRKVYQDPVSNMPIARFINPQDLIVNNNCTSLISSDRITHQMWLSKKEIKLRQNNGFYLKELLLEISEDLEDKGPIAKTVKNIEGISTEPYENKSLYKIFESHCNLDLNGYKHVDDDGKETGIPLPYIVTIDSATRKVLAIRRNWQEGDDSYKREEYFNQYQYLPGFGLYSLGILHIGGSNAIALTSILRQLIDKGTLKNFPGGLKVKGLRIENNDKAIGPSEFRDVETGGLPISQAIMPMPYDEPSVVLKDLRNEVKQDLQNLLSTAETQIADAKADAPVGTTLAMLEVTNKIQSSVLRGLHVSLSNELTMLADLFAKYLPDEPYPFAMPGGEFAIMRQDFSKHVDVVPVSDPNLTTATQRILRAEAELRLAQSAPQLHDLRACYKRMYEAMNVGDIDSILPPEKQTLPLDPVTENMNALESKPLKASLEQDHKSHMIVHQQLAQSNPEIAPALMAHIQEHKAYQYLIDMQQAMGINMPNIEALQDPQVQNQIAMQAAKVAQEQMQAQQQQQPPDPNTIMLMDIKQREQAAILKSKSDEQRIEAEAFKAQLQHEAEMAKLQANLDMAEDKNEKDLIIAEMRLKETAARAARTKPTEGISNG